MIYLDHHRINSMIDKTRQPPSPPREEHSAKHKAQGTLINAQSTKHQAPNTIQSMKYIKQSIQTSCHMKKMRHHV